MIRLGASLLATLVAVIISLTIASAKSSYETQDAHFRQLAANLVEVDQLLAQYGPEATAMRQHMREQVPAAIDRIWHEKATASQDTAFTARSLAEQLYTAAAALSPNNDTQRGLKSRVEQAIADIARTRLSMFADGDTPVLTPFMLILIFCQLRPVRRTRSGRLRCITGICVVDFDSVVPGRGFEPAVCRLDADTQRAAQAYAGAVELRGRAGLQRAVNSCAATIEADPAGNGSSPASIPGRHTGCDR